MNEPTRYVLHVLQGDGTRVQLQLSGESVLATWEHGPAIAMHMLHLGGLFVGMHKRIVHHCTGFSWTAELDPARRSLVVNVDDPARGRWWAVLPVEAITHLTLYEIKREAARMRAAARRAQN